MNKRKARVGSSFDDFLKEEGLLEEVTAGAVKKVLARPLRRSSRLMVLAERAKVRAIARMDRPSARRRLITSRSLSLSWS